MSCKSIFKKVNRDMLALDTLPALFRKARSTKSFREMVVSIRRAFREYLASNKFKPTQEKEKALESKLSRETLYSLGASIKFLTSKISTCQRRFKGVNSKLKVCGKKKPSVIGSSGPGTGKRARRR